MAKIPPLKVPEEFREAVREILEAASDEIPGKGVTKGLWRKAQKHISREQRREIKKLQADIVKLYTIIDSHAEASNQIRENNKELLEDKKQLKKTISDLQKRLGEAEAGLKKKN
ncbi:hypothetical protein [uncultured Parasphingopyxis sp.]|uniref:hypothetical protein n=1 Tax=uncultured Parasphingopyxis sp. TaxID=1547918 RepID=UPI00261CC044|nr:hypothetical protein [uncultured Parasphingopyxis sp.]